MPDTTASPFRAYLRQITYGGNDGIVTTFAIVAGFAGAQMQGAAGFGVLAVLVFGIANLTADGVSMGLGEFLSGRSARGLYHARLREEVARVTADRDGARARLRRYLSEQGLEEPMARHLANHLSGQPGLAADLILRYEDGMEAPEAHNAPLRALMTFVAFILFGLIPLLPYLVAPNSPLAFPASVVATIVALSILGILRHRGTGESLARALTETLVLGGICALVAWAAGLIVAGFG